MMPSDFYTDAVNDGLNVTLVLTQPSSLSDGVQKHKNQTLNCVVVFFVCFLCCCFQARANRGWSTSASTSASPATSACPSASTTYRSDCVLSSSPPSARSGKQSCLFSSLYKKKKKKTKNDRTKASFDCFPLCHTAASKPVKRPTLPVRSPSLPREKRWRQAVTVIARAPSSLSSCVIPSLVAHIGDYRRKIPLFLCAFPVTHCCSVIMLAVPVECFNPSNKKTVVDFSGNVSLKRMKKGENTKNCRDFYE